MTSSTRFLRRCEDDRGSIAVEFLMWVPAVIVFLAIAFVAGRIVMAGSAVDSSAAAAAREASIARSPGEAQANARAAAEVALSDQKLKCSSTSVNVDTSGFGAPLGAYGAVTVRVSCTVQLDDLGFSLGSKKVQSSFTSVIDRYRQR
ncbi:TadE/TadG family type IV pilus assembly protein [Streptomyces sp. NRRL S-350]|uniref:TadE/TadG family type IV pilus assembly protein n=1 Tax=Streptomyces sp. NRRL S-350 TaxID=1463902 RepID=UPI000B2F67C3|nr:TadE/TadG family type IV pilus assembly protein [Streptomyces sp. NRRL S-350]